MTMKEIKKEIANFLELETVRRDRMKIGLKKFEKEFEKLHSELISYYDQNELTKSLYYSPSIGFYTELVPITKQTGKDFWLSISTLIKYLETIPEQLKEKTTFREGLIQKISE